MYGDGITLWKENKRWACQLTLRDRSGQVKKYQRRRSTRSEAIEAIQDLKTQLFSASAKSSETLAGLLDEYISYKLRTVRINTAADYKHILSLYVLPRLGERTFDSVTAKDIIDLMGELSDRGLSSATVNTVRLRLSTYFEYAVMTDVAQTNPCKKVKSLRKERGRLVKDPWELEEVRKVLALSKGTDLELFIHLALFLGLRKGELLALKWSDVNLDEGWIQINKSRGSRRVLDEKGKLVTRNIENEPKTFSGFRRLPLASPLLLALMSERSLRDSLQQSCGPGDYLLRGQKGGPLATSTLYRRYNRFIQDNDLRRIRIHDNRHTAIVQSLEAGSRLEETSQGAGHSSVDITKRIYAPYVPALSKGFADALSNRLAEDPKTPSGYLEEVG